MRIAAWNFNYPNNFCHSEERKRRGIWVFLARVRTQISRFARNDNWLWQFVERSLFSVDNYPLSRDSLQVE